MSLTYIIHQIINTTLYHPSNPNLRFVNIPCFNFPFQDSVNRNSMSSSYPSCKNQMSRLSNSNKDLQRNQEKEKPKFIGPQLPRNLHSLKHPRDKSCMPPFMFVVQRFVCKPQYCHCFTAVMGNSGTLPANTTSAMNINHKPLQFGFIRKSTNVSDRKITVSNKMSNGVRRFISYQLFKGNKNSKGLFNMYFPCTKLCKVSQTNLLSLGQIGQACIADKQVLVLFYGDVRCRICRIYKI